MKARRTRAAFLDRDGTLMDDTGFIGDPKRVVLLDGVPEALRRLHDAGYACIVITNQSGVARGYFAERDVDAVNAELARQLKERGASIDAFYFCTHLEGCDCRKPLPGLVHRAAADHDIDLTQSVVFGDQEGDIALARSVGMPSLLVNSRASYAGPEPTFRARSLLEGVEVFLGYVHA